MKAELVYLWWWNAWYDNPGKRIPGDEDVIRAGELKMNEEIIFSTKAVLCFLL